MYTYIHIHLHIHIHIYIYTYIHTYIHTQIDHTYHIYMSTLASLAEQEHHHDTKSPDSPWFGHLQTGSCREGPGQSHEFPGF